MHDTTPTSTTPLLADPASNGTAAALTHAAFDAVLNGRRLSRTELLEATGASAADFDRLAGRALIFDGDDQLVAAHGLSLVPARQHRLRLRGRQFWTWCAVDAIGIPAGLGADAVAETTCQHCGTRVTVEFQAGELVYASHPGARIWEAARLEGRGTAGPRHCALMNLFCSAEHLAAWRQAHPDERGEERDLGQIAALGRTEWAYPQKCCQ